MPGFGRIPYMNPKSRRFNAAPVLLELPRRYRRDNEPWPKSRTLDQGQSGTCTGASLRGIYEGRPVPHKDGVGPTWIDLYRQIVLRDAWDENNAEADPNTHPNLESLVSGSSVDAAMMVGVDNGWWREVRWLRRYEEAEEWIKRRDGSPFMIGINWYQSFSNPAPDGTVSLRGDIEGGHAIKVRWHYRKSGLWVLSNSWGDSFGVNGELYMPDHIFKYVVFDQGGEAAIAVEQKAGV